MMMVVKQAQHAVPCMATISQLSSCQGLLYDRNNRTMIVFEARGVTFTTVET